MGTGKKGFSKPNHFVFEETNLLVVGRDWEVVLRGEAASTAAVGTGPVSPFERLGSH